MDLKISLMSNSSLVIQRALSAAIDIEENKFDEQYGENGQKIDGFIDKDFFENTKYIIWESSKSSYEKKPIKTLGGKTKFNRFIKIVRRHFGKIYYSHGDIKFLEGDNNLILLNGKENYSTKYNAYKLRITIDQIVLRVLVLSLRINNIVYFTLVDIKDKNDNTLDTNECIFAKNKYNVNQTAHEKKYIEDFNCFIENQK